MNRIPPAGLILFCIVGLATSGGLRAEERKLSTSAFATEYFSRLSKDSEKVKVSEKGIINPVSDGYGALIAPTFSFKMDLRSANLTYFNDGETGELALVVFRAPTELTKVFKRFDNIRTSGVLLSKAQIFYVAYANEDYLVFLFSDFKRIPIDSQVVTLLGKMLPRVGPE